MNQSFSRFTVDEQIKLVNGGSFFGTAGINEKDVKSMQFLDGGTGMNFEQLFGDMLSREGRGDMIGGAVLRDVLAHFYEPEKLGSDESRELRKWICEKLEERFPDWIAPGCYPPGILLGATWSPETVYETGRALGMEARAYGVNVLLGTPNVNMHRDIRNGRLFEGYSEDPCLASTLAPEMVKGVQSCGVSANVKHFVANHQETNRLNVNEIIPQRALNELYYPGFKACVKAGVATVMSAYNQINGVPCTENKQLLCDILRDDWGFDGLVMSDWGAVYNPTKAVNAGNDLAMPGPIAPDVLKEAYEKGELSPEALAVSAERVASLAEKYTWEEKYSFSREETDRIAYNASAEGIILLKNRNGALPLDKSSKVAVFGEKTDYLLMCGEGSAGINTDRKSKISDVFAQSFAEVTVNSYGSADAMVYIYNLPGQEGNDRADIGLKKSVTEDFSRIIPEAERVGMKKILVLNVSSPVALGEWEERFDAVICVFLPGMKGTQALADILTGDINPSGKLPLSWPARIEDMPTYLNFPGDGMIVNYGEGIFIGYRWYDTRKIAPLYPFGHGLSYTDFEITSIKADTERFSDSLKVTAVVKNTGSVKGKTVVQIYISDEQSTLTKPVKELKAFRKVELDASETAELEFTLNKHDFESFDPNINDWTFEEGWYTVSAGLSSADIHKQCRVYADVKSPYSYGRKTSVKVIVENPQLKKTVEEFFVEYNLPYTAILTSYEYTAQDKIEMILKNVGCDEKAIDELGARLSLTEKQ